MRLSMLKCIYIYVWIHTYITLHCIALHYMTWHDIILYYNTYIHMYTYIYIYICIHIYIYICIYVYILYIHICMYTYHIYSPRTGFLQIFQRSAAKTSPFLAWQAWSAPSQAQRMRSLRLPPEDENSIRLLLKWMIRGYPMIPPFPKWLVYNESIWHNMIYSVIW